MGKQYCIEVKRLFVYIQIKKGLISIFIHLLNPPPLISMHFYMFPGHENKQNQNKPTPI